MVDERRMDLKVLTGRAVRRERLQSLRESLDKLTLDGFKGDTLWARVQELPEYRSIAPAIARQRKSF